MYLSTLFIYFNLIIPYIFNIFHLFYFHKHYKISPFSIFFCILTICNLLYNKKIYLKKLKKQCKNLYFSNFEIVYFKTVYFKRYNITNLLYYPAAPLCKTSTFLEFFLIFPYIIPVIKLYKILKKIFSIKKKWTKLKWKNENKTDCITL